jgi:hypothetical protein
MGYVLFPGTLLLYIYIYLSIYITSFNDAPDDLLGGTEREPEKA